MSQAFIKGGLVVIILLLAVLVVRDITNGSGITGNIVYDGTPVKLDFYVMSQCPYGTQVEDAIAPVLDKFGSAVDFSLEFIGRTTPTGFDSLHGQPEVDGNKVQLCAAKYNPDKYMNMIVCMNKNANSIPDNWESCAKDLNVANIKQCYEGEEGDELLSASFARADEIGASGSPTIYLNDESYGGRRTEDAFTKAICGEIPDHDLCKNLPKVEEIELIVLNDERCNSCDPSQIVFALQQMFEGITPKYVDVSEAEELIEDYDIELVPAFIVPKSITESSEWKDNAQVQAAFESFEEGLKIRPQATGASYFVDEQKRMDFMNDIGVDLTDGVPQVDFFVMSYCPYGNQAEEIVYEVYNVLGNKAKYNPYYVIYSDYGDECLDDGNLCSLHGKQELTQNMREKCVLVDNGLDDWFDFVIAMNDACTYQNADSCWGAVAEDLGLDVDAISSCETERGIELMREDKVLQDKLGVTGSPTTFIEGSKYQGARDANSILVEMCANFEDKPSECDNVIATTAAAVPAGNCG
ncbi:thioredoxin domain-containing protein [Candidatus Woesearchaeota archaeon]|jgi:hypothetical protein|nr:thioredoxin domain-containing protein [Candidatus Woesearchaeota archaeon]MBT4368354.1 thioredoxin domain-containing protein [Candidatus Woesearchaeota archaeon]MBT4712843.1 thioredoxin domain-containing protein [Candidatus Woesearchaeota archaeon]MBT6639755.1 thioredoxin domain-containing protein [Candidatus Woesearchaeota archaeon]MBT7133927.1 thioredoxin domain-containing protein [Candidatus Woesearchaeota archaeon]